MTSLGCPGGRPRSGADRVGWRRSPRRCSRRVPRRTALPSGGGRMPGRPAPPRRRHDEVVGPPPAGRADVEVHLSSMEPQERRGSYVQQHQSHHCLTRHWTSCARAVSLRRSGFQGFHPVFHLRVMWPRGPVPTVASSAKRGSSAPCRSCPAGSASLGTASVHAEEGLGQEGGNDREGAASRINPTVMGVSTRRSQGFGVPLDGGGCVSPQDGCARRSTRPRPRR
jgi:hypothetical protein